MYPELSHHLVLCLEVAVGVGDGQGNGVLDLGDQSQHQKLVLGGGDVIARYRGRLTRRAGTADIAGTSASPAAASRYAAAASSL